jgi:diphthine synthase
MDAPTGRLTFVGLGLHDDKGMTLRALDEVIDADIVYAEEYTSALAKGSIENITERTGKMIRRLTRGVVEDGTAILDSSMDRRVALLVAGDPMTATTHIDLRLRAIKKGIRTEVIHGCSALVAVPGLLGLQHYKFGRTTTLPYPTEGYSPTSPYEVIEENLSRGLHTLVLLDIDAENERYMTANEGMHLLRDMERRVRKKIIKDDLLLGVVARAGAPDCMIRAGRISDLEKLSFGPPLHSIVVPGKLHFMEAEGLEVIGGAPHKIVAAKE